MSDDDARAHHALWSRPATCPQCGGEEPSGWALRNNHGAAPGEPGIGGFPPGRHPIYGTLCAAQYGDKERAA